MGVVTDDDVESLNPRKEVEERLIRRAQEDSEFYALLLKQPKTALARELGLDVPDGLEVTVLQETSTQFFIVLPQLDNPDIADETSTGAYRLAQMGLGNLY